MNRNNFLAILTVLFAAINLSAYCQTTISSNQIIPGAERTTAYFPLLKGKRVAVFANQTSMVKQTHLVDTLLNSGITVVKIFSPEHGFRGDASAGQELNDSTDKKTEIPIISLYGNHLKPTAAELKDVDVMLFDIQDVGVRFYTYISSLQYYIEAAIENYKPLIILDRPNPNGFYIDGPVLDTAYKSFIGVQPIPVVYGMTIGEYAQMLLYERWLYQDDSLLNRRSGECIMRFRGKPFAPGFSLTVITCENYDHNSHYNLPINPSPNLKEMQAIYLYPSTCFFEGTAISEGRGTDKPFEIFGHPSLPKTLYAFTPKPNAGAKSGKYFNQQCYGWNLSGTTESILKTLNKKIQLRYLLDAYKLFTNKDTFFLKNNFFNKLAGNAILMQQIKDGKTETEIRKTWEADLQKFKVIRKKYLLYKDFE
ncbi:MAG: DUF1343 domain-containing protein [Ferruginibacter sp.]